MKWMHHEEHAMVDAAVKEYRKAAEENPGAGLAVNANLAWQGELLARRVEMAVRSTDWRVVENRRA